MKMLDYYKNDYIEILKKLCLFILLFAIGLLFGVMRELQAGANNEDYQLNYYAIAIFTIAGTGAPIALSMLKRWIGGKISKMRLWKEKELQHSRQRRDVASEAKEVTQKRNSAERNLENIILKFSKAYEGDLRKKSRKEHLWKKFDRKLESDMSLYSEAYRRVQGNGRALQMVPKIKHLALPLILLLLIAFGCSSIASASDWFILCDRSSSASDACNKKALEGAFRGWLKEAATGDKFEVFVIGDDVYDIGSIYSVTVPKFTAPITRNKSQWKKTMLKDIDAIELPDTGKSAMFQAIWRVSQRITHKGSAMILISDLRHVDKRYNFEKNIPGGKEFIKYLKDQGIWDAGLKGHRVYVCGFHPNASVGTSIPTAKNLMQTRSLWEDVFSSWGIKVSMNEECNFEDF